MDPIIKEVLITISRGSMYSFDNIEFVYNVTGSIDTTLAMVKQCQAQGLNIVKCAQVLQEIGFIASKKP